MSRPKEAHTEGHAGRRASLRRGLISRRGGLRKEGAWLWDHPPTAEAWGEEHGLLEQTGSWSGGDVGSAQGGRDQISGNCGVRTYPQGKRAPGGAWEQSSPSFSVNPVFDPAEDSKEARAGGAQLSVSGTGQSPSPNSEAQGALTLGGSEGWASGELGQGQEVFVCDSGA